MSVCAFGFVGGLVKCGLAEDADLGEGDGLEDLAEGDVLLELSIEGRFVWM